MTRLRRIPALFVQGLFLGLAVVFLLIVALCAYAYGTDRAVSIAGFFRVFFEEENGMPAMSFEPNVVGMGIVVLVLALGYALVASRTRPASGIDTAGLVASDTK